MHITSLELKDFRNYSRERIEFSPGTNVIYGDNAQGKTNILEAVYLAAQGRGFRTKSDRELVRFGEQFAWIRVEFADSQREHEIVMAIDKNGKKAIKVNNVPVRKLSRLMSYLNVVMFSPEELELVKGSPSLRRRFLDTAISQLRPSYLASLAAYHKALGEKNVLLKQLKKAGAKEDATLAVWNQALAAEGAKIIEARRAFVEDMQAFAGNIQREISGEELKIEYRPSVDAKDAEELYEFLEKHKRREIEHGQAVWGVQRDDIRLLVNGADARLFGSQGQQRTCVLSLKMAQADWIADKKGEYPVLLLDDIMSELDINRRRYLAGKIRGRQVLITCTDDEDAPPERTGLIYVKNGRAQRITVGG